MAQPASTWYTVEIKHHTQAFRGVIMETLRPSTVVTETVYERRLRRPVDVSELIGLLQRIPD
jgi:hypothetical protein